MSPTIVFVTFGYVLCLAWTVMISFTSSKVLPSTHFIGLAQYERLWRSTRWWISVENIAIFSVLLIAGSLAIGFVIAVLLDQRIRSEDTFRTAFLYPYALSLIVTGAVWQWILNPQLGLQAAVRHLGWTGFTFNLLVRDGWSIYALVIAAIWQGSGLVVVLLLAGLRGVDQEIWKASRIDGIPTWRVYASIVVPELRPTIVTAVVLLAIASVKVYDLVVSMTQGGPGISSEMPAKFVMDYLFERGNIGLATAAATLILLTVVVLLSPWLYFEYFSKGRRLAR